jgi:hypothetical protein
MFLNERLFKCLQSIYKIAQIHHNQTPRNLNLLIIKKGKRMKHKVKTLIYLIGVLFYMSAYSAEANYVRDFKIAIPLFSEKSAWRQKVEHAKVLPLSDDTILTTYRVLKGYSDELVPSTNITPDAKMWVNADEWSYPIYRAKSEKTSIDICMYDGMERRPEDVFGTNLPKGGPVDVDAPAGTIRPAGPRGDSDGHLVLINPDTNIAWDYWQATTKREARCAGNGSGGVVSNQLLEAGAATFFDLKKDGVSTEGSSSAQASGFPLLAGTLLPEDFAAGKISHALKFSIPGPRNLSPRGDGKLKTDYAYPATSTEDKYGRMNTNKNAMIMGTRIRLKDILVDENGERIDESTFSPATKMVLRALREYGAYLADNAGSFAFYAEDSHSGKLDVSNEKLFELIGDSVDTSQTPWKALIGKVQKELYKIPLAYGSADKGEDASSSSVLHANFEVVEYAIIYSSTTPTEPIPTDGQTIYVDNCVDCHGAGNDSEVKDAPLSTLRNVLKNGKDSMPAFPNLSVDAIYDYFKTLNGGTSGGENNDYGNSNEDTNIAHSTTETQSTEVNTESSTQSVEISSGGVSPLGFGVLFVLLLLFVVGRERKTVA